MFEVIHLHAISLMTKTTCGNLYNGMVNASGADIALVTQNKTTRVS